MKLPVFEISVRSISGIQLAGIQLALAAAMLGCGIDDRSPGLPSDERLPMMTGAQEEGTNGAGREASGGERSPAVSDAGRGASSEATTPADLAQNGNERSGVAGAAPDTTLISVPPALSKTSAVTFEFTSTASGSFECQMDASALFACSSPHAISVPEGEHVFSVTAIDDVGVRDATPALYSFVIDLTGPETQLRGGPAPSSGNNPQFAFSSPEETATFECQLDDSPFMPCSSPSSDTVTGSGSHTFTVRAVDAVGNADPTPESSTFYFDQTAVSTFSDSRTIFCSDGLSAIPCPTSSDSPYGQDGNFLHRPEYLVTADTVLDATSGLMWERANGQAATWDSQVARCAALTAGGFTDWRMPSRLEMLTVIDAGRTGPALDTSVFLDAAFEGYWLGQELDDVPTSAWLFNGYDANLSWNGKDAFNAAKCVRGAASSGSFTLSVSGLSVYDSHTGSTWQGTSSGLTLSWVEALSYCNDLDFDGFSDWRLPSVKELATLIDATSGRNPPEIPLVFPGRDGVHMWTSSPHPAMPSQSYTLDMLNGAGFIEPVNVRLQARCVR